MAKKEKIPKRKNMIYSMEDDMAEDLAELMDQTGASKTEIGRRALRMYLDGGKNDPVLMFEVVQLIQQINDLENKIPKEDYEKLQHSVGNIMKLKGGK